MHPYYDEPQHPLRFVIRYSGVYTNARTKDQALNRHPKLVKTKFVPSTFVGN